MSQKGWVESVPRCAKNKDNTNGKRKIQTKNWKNDIDDTLMLSKCSTNTCVFANPQDFLWNTCGIDQPFLAVLHYQEFPIGSRSVDSQKPNMAKIVQRGHQDTTIRQNFVGGLGPGALESLGLRITSQTMIPCVWQYGNMVILTNAQFGKMSPQGPSTQSQRVRFLLCCIPFFCSAKPCFAVRQMENSHGNGVEQGILASPTQSPSKEATKVKLPSLQERVWITNTTQNS